MEKTSKRQTHTIFLGPPPHNSIIFALQEEAYGHDSQLLTFISVNRDPAKKQSHYQMRTTCKILTQKTKKPRINPEIKKLIEF